MLSRWRRSTEAAKCWLANKLKLRPGKVLRALSERLAICAKLGDRSARFRLTLIGHNLVFGALKAFSLGLEQTGAANFWKRFRFISGQ
jgi:hypothetical protein